MMQPCPIHLHVISLVRLSVRCSTKEMVCNPVQSTCMSSLWCCSAPSAHYSNGRGGSRCAAPAALKAGLGTENGTLVLVAALGTALNVQPAAVSHDFKLHNPYGKSVLRTAAVSKHCSRPHAANAPHLPGLLLQCADL